MCGAEPRQGLCRARHLNCEKSDPGACGRAIKSTCSKPRFHSVMVIWGERDRLFATDWRNISGFLIEADTLILQEN